MQPTQQQFQYQQMQPQPQQYQYRQMQPPIQQIPHITLIVKSQVVGELELSFQLKVNTSIELLKHSYCEKMKVLLNESKFFYQGKELPYNITPGDCGMKDGDVLYYYNQSQSEQI